jgi:hypothetical protein
VQRDAVRPWQSASMTTVCPWRGVCP